MTFAHPKHFRRLQTAQRAAPVTTDRLDDPGHSDLRQHPTPPVAPNQTDRVLRNADIPCAMDTGSALDLSGHDLRDTMVWLRQVPADELAHPRRL